MIRRLAAAALLVSGVVWSIGFPKKATFDPDMVESVAIAIGLLGTGAIVLYSNRFQRWTSVLSTLLLWSLVANLCLVTRCVALAELLAKSNVR